MSIDKKRRKKLKRFLANNDLPPLSAYEIAVMLEVPTHQRDTLLQMLDQYVKSGFLSVNRSGRYHRSENQSGYQHQGETGTYYATTGNYGFVKPDQGDEPKDDLFVPPNQSKDAIHKDKVLFIRKNNGEATIIKVVKRNIETIYGMVWTAPHQAGINPVHTKIKGSFMLHPKDAKKVQSGDFVKARIEQWNDMVAKVRLLEVADRKSLIRHVPEALISAYDIEVEFSEQAVLQTESMKDRSAESLNHRNDMRDLLTVTIDGEEAKDFDDAVSISKTKTGFTLYVHIADVSEYVLYQSALDQQAMQRGTSVYYPQNVIPMLPQKLSNELCSLRPDEDKMCVSVRLDFDEYGNRQSFEVYPSVIRSDHRLTYTAVQKLIDNHFESKNYGAKTIEAIQHMHALYQMLNKNRLANGSINFDFAECEIKLDENGYPIDIVPVRQRAANGIIEEFMLCCNQAIACFLTEREAPCIYRIHEKPDFENLNALVPLANALGFRVKRLDRATQTDVSKIIAQAQGTTKEEAINTFILRALKKAKYHVKNVGHYALAMETYCHFTSPIRRYPDLVNHRIVKAILQDDRKKVENKEFTQYLKKAAQIASERERNAEELEREILAHYKCVYMQQYIGKKYQAVIMDLNTAGIRVRLDNTVTGMAFFRNMMDYYVLDEHRISATGDYSGTKLRIGDMIEVTVAKVDMQARQIEFHVNEPGML